jgi:hypothetical protein
MKRSNHKRRNRISVGLLASVLTLGAVAGLTSIRLGDGGVQPMSRSASWQAISHR